MPSSRLRSSTNPIKLFAVLVAGLCFSFTAYAETPRQPAVVKEVLTGDTLRLEGGKVLAYTGLHAPPLQHIVPLVREYGAQALAKNKALVEGKKIFIEWGPQIRDDQNRLLGYVYLEDGTFVNQVLLSSGNAKLRIKAPNLLHAESLRQAELDARRQKLGVWEKEPENPFIQKEYIGEKNTKIFYFPNSSELEKIPAANLVSFASRVEAKAAGYRPCRSWTEADVLY